MQAQLELPDQVSDGELDQLSQAARFVTHLQLQLAELDRREQQLNEQASAVHAQTLLAKRAIRASQDDANRHRAELQQQAAQLAEGEETLRQRVLILRQQEEEYARKFELLTKERDQLRQNQLEENAAAERELTLKREALRSAESQSKAEHEQRLLQLARLQQESQQQLTEAQAAFQAEQIQLRQVIDAEKAGAWQEVEVHRSRFADEMERERADIEALKLELREAHAAAQQTWLQKCEQEQAELAALKADLQTQREEQERVNQQWVEHRKEEKRQHLLTLEEISRERLSNLDLREREIQQREIDLQKRFRLHEDHLEMTRRGLAAQKSEMEWQEQQQRIWVEQVESSIRLRLGQMRKYRELLSQRESSLADEQQLFIHQRRETETLLQRQRENLQMERVRTAEIREEEVRSQLSLQTRLEDERTKLAQHREEVQEICRQLSEGLALLKSKTELPDTDGSHTHLSQLVSMLSRQLVEMESARTLLIEQQQQQRAEHVQVSEWIEGRDAWVRERETMFNQQLAELSDRESICQKERETWRTERIQVEQLIRDLVQQLENSSVPPTNGSVNC